MCLNWCILTSAPCRRFYSLMPRYYIIVLHTFLYLLSLTVFDNNTKKSHIYSNKWSCSLWAVSCFDKLMISPGNKTKIEILYVCNDCVSVPWGCQLYFSVTEGSVRGQRWRLCHCTDINPVTRCESCWCFPSVLRLTDVRTDAGGRRNSAPLRDVPDNCYPGWASGPGPAALTGSPHTLQHPPLSPSSRHWARILWWHNTKPLFLLCQQDWWKQRGGEVRSRGGQDRRTHW